MRPGLAPQMPTRRCGGGSDAARDVAVPQIRALRSRQLVLLLQRREAVAGECRASLVLVEATSPALSARP